MHIYSNHGILEITGDTCGGAFGCCGPFNVKFKCSVQSSKHLRDQLVFEEISLKGSAAFYSKKDRYVELNFPHMLPLFPTIYGAHS